MNLVRADIFNTVLTRPEYIICDWDGVIQEIAILWMEKVLEEQEYFEPYLDFNKLLIKETDEYDPVFTLDREVYLMNEWLKRPNINMPKEALDFYINLYLEDMDFYINCPYLRMAKAIKELMKERFIKKIVFLTATPQGYTDRDVRKLRAMIEYFGVNISPELMDMEFIEGGRSKGEHIAKYHPDYTTFIDDDPNNIRDVIENTDSNNKQYIMPDYKYNRSLSSDKDYLKRLYDKGSMFSIYRQDMYEHLV